MDLDSLPAMYTLDCPIRSKPRKKVNRRRVYFDDSATELASNMAMKQLLEPGQRIYKF